MMRQVSAASLLAAILLLLTWRAGTAAETAPASPSELDAAFADLLHNPSDVDANLRFAEIAARQGNAEAAVGALERLLAERPDLPQLRLQLGLLYVRLGSYTMARAYLEPLASGADDAGGVREAAKAELRRIDKLTARNQLGGSLFVGAQTQTNPGAAPASPVFLVSGVQTTASSSFAKRSDYDFFGQAQVTDSYDLDTEFGDRLEATAAVYGAGFSRQHQLDFAWTETTIGPRLASERVGIAGGSFRPYLLGSYVELGGATYYNAYGGGIDYAQRLGRALPTVSFDYQSQQQNYRSSSDYPTARELNGRLDYVAIGLAQPLGALASVGLTLSDTRQNARIGGLSNDDYALAANGTLAYGAGLSPFHLPLVTTLTVVGHYLAYDAPDPAVSPTSRRSDHRWQFIIGEVVPVTTDIALKGQIYRDVYSSNISNFSYTNTSFLIGPQITF
jgi:tetratricopeptide (TPR) repeat protein